MKIAVDVPDDASKAAVGIGETRTAHAIQKVQNLFPIVEGVKERRKPTEVHDIGAEPEEMAGNAIEFRTDDPDVLGTKWRLDPGELLHGEHEAMVVEHPGQVIHPAGVGQKLLIGAVLTHLFMAAMPVADDRVGLDDEFSIQIEQYPEHPVSARMLRPEIETVNLLHNRLRKLLSHNSLSVHAV